MREETEYKQKHDRVFIQAGYVQGEARQVGKARGPRGTTQPPPVNQPNVHKLNPLAYTNTEGSDGINDPC